MITFINQLLINFILKHLPNRGKRIIYLLFTYLLMMKQVSHDRDFNNIIEINNRLKIYRDNEVIYCIFCLFNLLSKSDDFKRVECRCSQSVFNSFPPYLKYDDDDRMHVELDYLFKWHAQHQLT